jgi:hypothetical protein
VKGNTCNVRSMAVKGKDRIRVGRLDIVELDSVVAGGSEVALVRRYAKAVDLRVWVRNSAGADPRQCFPESDVKLSVQIATNACSGACKPNSVVIASYM